MRAHGISDFPDPNANGGLDLNAGGGSDLEPNNPQFQAAQKACQSLLPPPPTEAQQKQQRAAALRYAKCMRAHGISDFPDPSANGGIMMNKDSGIDPESDTFKAAQQKCESLMPRPSMRASR